jgi:hypothetical protein
MEQLISPLLRLGAMHKNLISRFHVRVTREATLRDMAYRGCPDSEVATVRVPPPRTEASGRA